METVCSNAQAIRELRRKKGLSEGRLFTQETVAMEAGISLRLYQDMEKDNDNRYRMEGVDALVRYYKVYVDEIFLKKDLVRHILSVPNPKNNSFVPNDNHQETSDPVRDNSPSARIYALTGPAGIGKTEIANSVCYSSRRLPVVWWINCGTTEGLLSDLARLSEELGSSPVIESIAKRLDVYGQWLLVYDNADSVAAIEEYIPKAGGGTVVVTTRDAQRSNLAETLPVPGWDESDLNTFCFSNGLTMGADGLQKLTNVLGGNPLALCQASIDHR